MKPVTLESAINLFDKLALEVVYIGSGGQDTDCLSGVSKAKGKCIANGSVSFLELLVNNHNTTYVVRLGVCHLEDECRDAHLYASFDKMDDDTIKLNLWGSLRGELSRIENPSSVTFYNEGNVYLVSFLKAHTAINITR